MGVSGSTSAGRNAQQLTPQELAARLHAEYPDTPTDTLLQQSSGRRTRFGSYLKKAVVGPAVPLELL